MKKYQIIYADPPWQYRDTARYKNFRPHGMGAVHHYSVMPTDDICNLKVPSDRNSILFLWVTTPFLEDGFKVLNAWGYKYKTALYWDKVNFGTGHYFRGQVEVLLVGVKGKIKAFHKQIRNLIREKNTKHSKKPHKVYEIIDSLGYETKLELFAREKTPGWDVWGNEVDSDIELKQAEVKP